MCKDDTVESVQALTSGVISKGVQGDALIHAHVTSSFIVAVSQQLSSDSTYVMGCIYH